MLVSTISIAVKRVQGRTLTPQQRAAILTAFDASGLSARSFVKRHGLKYTTFMNWVSRRGDGSASKRVAGGSISLVEAVLSDPEHSYGAQASGGITVEGPGEVRIHLTDRDSVVLVVDLLRALKG